MQRETKDLAYLWDMLDAAKLAREFLGSKSLDEYLKDPMLQAAIERKIEIVGEAAGKISNEFRLEHQDIPWKGIIGQRNVLIHDYGDVDPIAVWKVVKDNIPELIKNLETILPQWPSEA